LRNNKGGNFNFVPEIRPTILKGHKNDVLDVAICPQEKHIVSVGRDRNTLYWNLLGELKHTIENEHHDWITGVEFLPYVSDKEL
jgi:WD40 repeat protein